MHDPGGEQSKRDAEPAAQQQQVREHEPVRAPCLAVVLDRVRERRPCRPERREEEHDHARDPHADRVQARLRRARDRGQEEPIDEVDRPEREPRRDERHPEPVHLAEQRPVELQTELVTTVGEEDRVDDERPREVSDEDADRALVPHGDKENGRPDRHNDVRKRSGRELNGALLDAEQRRQLLVVHLRPQADEGRAHETGCHPVQRVRDGRREGEPRDEPGRRGRHREPERRPHDDDALLVRFRVEIETEECGGDPGAQHDHEHGGERDQGLDRAVVRARQVVRVEREEENRQDPRHEPADPVHERVTSEALQLGGEAHSDS